MEIRNNSSIKMDDSDNTNIKTSSVEEFSRPLSPCESEISVGCEVENGAPAPASPMDMTEEMTEDDEGENGANSPSTSLSRSLSRDARSPQTLSPVSVHDESESFTYLSEDEYFRPLKRLAMSDSSPQAPTSTQEHLSESMSSPEPSSNPSQHNHQHQQQTQQQQHQQESKMSPKAHPRQQSPKLKALQKIKNDERKSEERERERQEEEEEEEEEEERERREEIELQAEQKLSGLRSFSILDILSYKPSRRKSSIPVKIVRPWDTREDSTTDTTTTRPSHPQETINNNNSSSNNNNTSKRQGQNNDRGSALDALFKMTNKTLDNLNKEDKADAVNLFNNRQPTKKKRKSRTAFTNHQIFELEKRFLYQKYLSPADRDELAQSLGLSNAQVITWFQNRRAKLKRDMEELKRDVESSKVIHNKTLLEASANVVAFLKAKELPKIHLASLPH